MSLLRTFEQARHELGSPGRFRASLQVGARFGLWDHLLVDWLGRLRKQDPDLQVRAQVGFEAGLMHQLVEGDLDIAVMYTPQSRPGLKVELLLEEELVLVASPNAARGPTDRDNDYVYVDWGPEFHARHMQAFPDFSGAAITVDIGWLGLQHLRAFGGSGYFPRRLVAQDLAQGHLVSVEGAPGFSMPAYAVYHVDSALDALAPAMALLRQCVATPGST